MPDVGFVFADDLVALFGVVFGIDQVNGRAEHHLAAGVELLHVDDLRQGEFGLKVPDTCFRQSLLLLRGMVFGVLAQIAVLPGGADGGAAAARP